jgi:signal transduction histidine kinase
LATGTNRTRRLSRGDQSAPLPTIPVLLEALGDGAVLFDSQGMLQCANSRAARWLGVPREGLVGLTREAWEARLAAAFEPEPGKEAEGRLRSREVPYRYLQHTIHPVAGGRLDLLRDMAAVARWERERDGAVQRQERELAALRTRLEQLDRYKMELTANVSHDLRTPIASIKASVSGLLAGDVDYDSDSLRETLTVIEEEADRLQRRVQNLLSMARMEAGDADLSEDWVDMSDVVGAALESLKGVMGPRAVLQSGDAEVPLVRGDHIQLQVAVRNLVENALLYSPATTPVEIAVTSTLGQVRVRVRDHGPGLMPDEFERVFDKFYRGRAARRIPGTGLGLAICRGIAEAHGGRLWAEHAPGGGVAFVLSLPVAEAPAEDNASPEGNSEVTLPSS